MATLMLKIHFNEGSVDKGQGKTLKLDPEAKVGLAVELSRQKIVPDRASERWRFFVMMEDSGISYWMDNDQPLKTYNLTGATVYLKSNLTFLEVTDLDGVFTKRVQVDLSAPVESAMKEIALKFSLDDVSEFGLQIPKKGLQVLRSLD